MRFSHSLVSLLALSIAASAFGGSGDGKSAAQPVVEADPLMKGNTEFEALAGYFHSPFNVGSGTRPEFDYSGLDLRYGWVLSPVLFKNSSLLRGDFEFLVDGFGDGVTKGAGNYLVGGSLLFRYNFFHPGSRWIPYLQLGGGGLHSDAAEVPDQRVIGGNFEFLLQADLGLRVMLNSRWSLLIEGGYQHISNADTASRNVGVNALGGRLGVGWLY